MKFYLLKNEKEEERIKRAKCVQITHFYEKITKEPIKIRSIIHHRC